MAAGVTRPAGAGGRLPEAAGAEQARSLLALLQAEYARLAAAARAAVAAADAGESDPLAYVRSELARHGGLPPRNAAVTAMLADAVGAMRVAGRAARLPDLAGKAVAS